MERALELPPNRPDGSRPMPEPSPKTPHDCLVISDLHLGSDMCQARLLESFLEWASTHTRTLVINGDIFDDLNFKRLSKRHFACLKVIRRNTDRDDFRVIWIRGNHDGPADIISHIVGVQILDEYIYEDGPVRLLIFHGDQFDHFITRYKWITAAACKLFYGIQRWFPHRASRWIRRVSKKWQRNSQLVQRTAVEYAQQKGCRYVTCGHTHLPLSAVVGDVHYFNTGTWTDHPPCPFLSVRGGEVRLLLWPPDGATIAAGDDQHIAERLDESLR